MSAIRARSSQADPDRSAYGDFDHQDDILANSDDSDDDVPELLNRDHNGDSSDDDDSDDERESVTQNSNAQMSNINEMFATLNLREERTNKRPKSTQQKRRRQQLPLIHLRRCRRKDRRRSN